MEEQFNIQPLFKTSKKRTIREQCKRAIRKSYIHLDGDTSSVPQLTDKHQRKLLRTVLATREYQADKEQKIKDDIIHDDKINELVQRFFMYHQVQRSDFFIAGGFLLRMLENPDTDIGELASQHDVDVFYRKSQDVLDWITTLRANGVSVERVGEYNHGLFKITSRSEPLPFLVQFTYTYATHLYELLESFDLPICQIGVNNGRRCATTFGFDVAWENKKDATTYVYTGEYQNDTIRKFYEARLEKYRARGYNIKVVPYLVYYGRTKFAYADDINDDDIRQLGKVDEFFASQTWINGETWADRWRAHKKN